MPQREVSNYWPWAGCEWKFCVDNNGIKGAGLMQDSLVGSANSGGYDIQAVCVSVTYNR